MFSRFGLTGFHRWNPPLRRDRNSAGRRRHTARIEVLERREYLAAHLVISEFMASNDGTLLDSDGSSSDWIEIHHAGTEPASLRNWSLTDDRGALDKWRFPDTKIEPGGYLVVFASGKDRRPDTGPLHTSFKLSASGEYVALVSPEGVVVSEYGRQGTDYPQQITNVSYGLGGNSADHGFLATPTPGAPNSLLRSGTVTFDRPSGLFQGTLTLRLMVDTPGATIHFTTDGSVPSEAAAAYDDSEPLVISSTTLVQAIAVAPGLSASAPASAWYTTLAPDLQGFSSNLPVLTLENFAAGKVPKSDTDTFQFTAFSVYEPDPATGRTYLLGAPSLQTRAGLRRRGSSTGGQVKPAYSLEAWDDQHDDKDIAPLGMAPESDWILFTPYEYDRALLRNPFIYDLSNQMGRYAARTRFVELYCNTDGGDLSLDDYAGVYMLMEKIKRDPARVAITELQPGDNSEPEISGGWILKIDRPDPGDSGFRAGGIGVGENALPLVYVDPKEDDVTPEQAAWIKNNIDRMAASLADPSPETGYAQYIDVDSWIDHHILNLLAMNVDAFRLSAYLCKDRGGKWEMGPIWDFDRSMESTDSRDDRPDVWQGPPDASIFFDDDPRHPWWGILFDDPNFMQRWIDRWFELRRTVLSEANIAASIDAMAAEIAEAAARNFDRWRSTAAAPRSGAQYASGKLDGTWRGEVEHMKAWLMERVAWIDSQFPAPPAVDPPGGRLPVGTGIRLAVAEGTIYTMADGGDPRLPGGAVHPDATTFNPTETLVDGTSTARYLVPTGNADEFGWQTGAFVDTAWNAGRAGVGYDTHTADPLIDLPGGFTVREVHSNDSVVDLTTASQLLAGTNVAHETTVTNLPVINFHDGADIDYFASNLDFPGGGGNDFALEATATLVVNVADTYRFGISSDDGFLLRIDGAIVTSKVRLGAPEDRFKSVALTAGPHELHFVMFQREAGAKAELFFAPEREVESSLFEDTFVLLGDEDRTFSPCIQTDVQAAMYTADSSLYVRIPFVVDNAADTQRLSFHIRYDDGFVAYLNGVEVACRNAPENSAFDSAATERQMDNAAVAAEVIDLSPVKDLLRDGDNLLAIHGLNVAADDADFLALPQLDRVRFGDPLILTGALPITARTWLDGAWSAPVDAPFLVAGSPDDASHLAITEVHYHPAHPTAAELAVDATLGREDFEFIELQNRGDHAIDLGGISFVDGVDFAFPGGAQPLLAPGAFVLVVRNRAAFEARYGASQRVAGQFAGGQLDNRGEAIVLVDRFGLVLQEFAYRADGDWPRRADGIGSSLEVIDPAGGYGDAANWRHSSRYGGSPGAAGADPVTDIVINEVLSRSGGAELDLVELCNTTGAVIDIGGWYLGNDPENFRSTAVPDGMRIGAGEYLTLSSAQTGLTLDGSQGDRVWLIEVDASGQPVRFVDEVAFGGSETGASLGRWPNAGRDANLFPMVERTFGAANGGPVAGEVVLSEIHYHPPATDGAAAERFIADFDGGTAGGFAPLLGTWGVVDGRYRVAPTGDAGGDAVATISLTDSVPSHCQISATLRLPAASAYNQSGAILFDYRGPTDFKFVSVHLRAGQWRIGQRDADGWSFLVYRDDQAIAAETDLAVSLEIDGSTAILRSGGIHKTGYDFGTPLAGGQLGLGSKSGELFFDDVTVARLPDGHDFEFVELRNTSDRSIDLAGWKLAGGIDWAFAGETTIAAGEFLVVVGFDPDRAIVADAFRRSLATDASVRLVGPYKGRLDNAGDVVELLRPLEVGAAAGGMVVVDRVAYDDTAPWAASADGGGDSLHRTQLHAFGSLAPSFRALAPSPGTETFVRPGDLDLNGLVDVRDVPGFALALADTAFYAARFGVPAVLGGDLDCDGDVDFDDIDELLSLLARATAESQGAVARVLLAGCASNERRECVLGSRRCLRSFPAA